MFNVFSRTDVICFSTCVFVCQYRWKPAKFGEAPSRWGYSTLQFVFIYHSTWPAIMMYVTHRPYSWKLHILNTNTNAFYLRPLLKQQATEINCYQGELLVHCYYLQCHTVWWVARNSSIKTVIGGLHGGRLTCRLMKTHLVDAEG
jgi:hypothetical protein